MTRLFQLIPAGLRKRLFHIAILLLRPMTLGVRILAITENGEVVLVKHTYVTGWSLPGGGVERGETVLDAAVKELREETGFEPVSTPHLHQIYLNELASPRDHVALLVATVRPGPEPFRPNREIAEMETFSPDALPGDTMAATRKRIAEVLDGLPPAEHW